MIKRVIERVHTLFKRKPKRGSGREPKRIPASEHHINRELVSRSALRVCETLVALQRLVPSQALCTSRLVTR